MSPRVAALAARLAARPEFFSVPCSHPGQTIFIFAGGPSLAGQPLDRIAGRPTIAVNLSYSVAPDATYIYAQDGRFVRRHMEILKRRFAGRFVTVSRKEAWDGLLTCRKREPTEGLPTKPTDLAARRTSLAGAISIAAHMTGPGGRIAILGLDGGRAPDGRSHHHAAHPWPCKDENFQGQHDDLVPLKQGLDNAGITVTNCSPGSRWRDLWPIMSLVEFLDMEGKGMSAESWSREEKRAKYLEAFKAEAARTYPAIDQLIAMFGGYELPSLATMARDLACPLKEHAPNWQHGRVLYAMARNYLARARVAARENEGGEWPIAPFLFLDIGTAKGFSALCLFWALSETGAAGEVHSFDVVDPAERVARNSIAELDGLRTVEEFIAPHLPAETRGALYCHKHPGMLFDEKVPEGRINIAFVDGKHKRTDVLAEAMKIGGRQAMTDFILFDDWQVPGVKEGISAFMQTSVGQAYRYTEIPVNAVRAYRMAERMQ